MGLLFAAYTGIERSNTVCSGISAVAFYSAVTGTLPEGGIYCRKTDYYHGLPFYTAKKTEVALYLNPAADAHHTLQPILPVRDEKYLDEE